MVAGVIRISDKFELGDKGSKQSSDWNEATAADDNGSDCNGNSGGRSGGPEGMNSFAFGLGATLFLLAQCLLIAVWICIYQRHKTAAHHSAGSRDAICDAGEDDASHPPSGNFGTLFPIPPSLPGKGGPEHDFRDYNPYTADLFRRRPAARADLDSDLGDFPSLHSVSSVASSVASVGAATTMYASLVPPPPKSGGKASFWSRVTTAESTNPAFESDDQRKT
jgi:hypothetical protein